MTESEHGNNPLEFDMNKRSTSLIFFASLAVAIGLSVYLAVKASRHRIANANVSHRVQGDAKSSTYPVFLSHSILDSEGKPRIVMLHRLTRPAASIDPPPFSWVDRIAIDPNGSKLLELSVAGEPVWVNPARTQFFLATDDNPPERADAEADCVSHSMSPREVWTTASALQSSPMKMLLLRKGML